MERLKSLQSGKNVCSRSGFKSFLVISTVDSGYFWLKWAAWNFSDQPKGNVDNLPQLIFCPIFFRTQQVKISVVHCILLLVSRILSTLKTHIAPNTSLILSALFLLSSRQILSRAIGYTQSQKTGPIMPRDPI